MDDEALTASPWADVPSSPKPPADIASGRTSFEASKLAQELATVALHGEDKAEQEDQAVVSEIPERQDELKDGAPWGDENADEPVIGPNGVKGIMAAFDGSNNEDVEDDDEARQQPSTFLNQPEEDFDDFDEPMDGNAGFQTGDVTVDDDFGDFGDFEEGDGDIEVPEPVAPSQEYQEPLKSLRLDPFPSSSSLAQQIAAILEPMFPNATGALTDEPLRQVGGLGQIMSSDSSREAYAQLTTPPMLKPLDWTRSRTRREHLISLGVPVNLDEVDSHRLTALPPLTITTSAYKPPAPPSDDRSFTAAEKGKGRASALLSDETERKEQQRQKESYGLGRKPDFNHAKADELLNVAEERLSLMPRAVLERIQKDLVETSAQASALLAHLLQLKDAQTNDSVTYNGLISELISNAQKMKAASTAASGGGVFRKSSVRKATGPMGGSGSNTPRRTASPSLW